MFPKPNLLSALLILLCAATMAACTTAPTPPPQPSRLAPLPSSTPTPAGQIPWRQYELALLRASVRDINGRCEWELIGHAEREVFVWAKCQSSSDEPTIMSFPAVIYISLNGKISGAQLPRDGNDFLPSMNKLFPPEVVKTIVLVHRFPIADLDHIAARTHPLDPPLIIALGTAMPPAAIATPTPAPRWVIYEKAISKAVMGSEGYLCEWEIYGVSGNKVYVWALCESPAPWGAGGSMPLVIVLSDNGQTISVDENCISLVVNLPLRKTCFPPPAQATILSNPLMGTTAPRQNLVARRTSHGPPLLVVQGTPLP
jgi:hypothetical protein